MNSLELSVQDLLVSGERGRTLLTVEQLVVHPGETVGIRGPSGAGKSTMLYALAGLANVAQGQVRWGDAELSTMGEEARARFRRSSVGMVFQDFLLFEELDAVSNAAICYRLSAWFQTCCTSGAGAEHASETQCQGPDAADNCQLFWR